MSRGPRRRRRRIGTAVFVVLLLFAAAGYAVLRAAGSGGTGCLAADAGTSYALDLDQAANAATVAVVGRRLGLPERAVTVALAAALQESKLRDLPSGDRDSVGLFQQRPSQGWGTPGQLRDPVYAATAFYRALAKVPGWSGLAIADAAQAVQHSAGGSAYGDWAAQAQVLANVLTGAVPAGLACRFSASPRGTGLPVLRAAMAAQLGSPSAAALPARLRGWPLVSWLVAHADDLGISAVSYNHQRWSADSGSWRGDPPAVGLVVRFAGDPQVAVLA